MGEGNACEGFGLTKIWVWEGESSDKTVFQVFFITYGDTEMCITPLHFVSPPPRRSPSDTHTCWLQQRCTGTSASSEGTGTVLEAHRNRLNPGTVDFVLFLHSEKKTLRTYKCRLLFCLNSLLICEGWRVCVHVHARS